MKKHYFIRGRAPDIFKYLLVFIFYLLNSAYSPAQNRDTVDYFPLKYGNQYLYWKYWIYQSLHNCIPDTTGYKETNGWQEINKSIIIDGKNYYVIPGFFWNANTLRIEDNNLWYYFSNRESLLFKFNSLPGETWKCDIPLTDYKPYEHIITLESKTDTITTKAGKFV